MNNLLFIDDDSEILGNYRKLFTRNFDKVDATLKLLNIPKSEKPKLLKRYEVYTASQGLDGVEIIKKGLKEGDPINVVFIDMRMPPGIDGCETAKRIREIDSDIEIVVVTAYSDKSLDKIIDAVGAPDKLLYLKKPFDPVEIQQFALNLSEKYEYNKIKDKFLDNVGHELKTPLNGIMGFSELLLDKKGFDDDTMESLEIIHRNSKNMALLIDELLTMVKIREKTLRIEKSKASLNVLVKSASCIIKPIIKEEVELKINYLEEDLDVILDEGKINQCLINILNNSCKFTQKGEIEISVYTNEGHIFFKIRDTGYGIPGEKLEMIFNRFSRIEDTHHSVVGLGLGLAITKEIIDQHKGEINVESELGVGTTFCIKIPLEKEDKRNC